MATGYEPSRQELLAWVNELLQLGYVKVEQMGTGAAHCQILDSIYGDVPISRVKWGSNQEIYHIDNFKILQASFKKHKIDKPIPIDRLVKCKVLDNLEFFQWMKKFWDQYYQPGTPYDAVARRAGAAGSAATASRNAAPAPRVASDSNRSSSTSNPIMQARVRTTQSGSPALPRNGMTTSHSSAGHQTGGPAAEIKRLKQELAEREAEVEQLTADVEGAEKESRFYFEKLRLVEQIIQEKLPVPNDTGSVVESMDEMSLSERQTLERIQATLYETEDGFENPPPNGEVVGGDPFDETF